MTISGKARKQIRDLPGAPKRAAWDLVREIGDLGPVRGNWPNYGKISPVRHHCHLCKGKTTYVAVWEVLNKRARVVEIRYAGTHEKANY